MSVTIIENGLSFGSMSTRSKTTEIILHHAEASTCTVEQIHGWHKNNGWSGIGYHFLIRKDGKIYRGRPINTVGAHCTNHNSNTIGICFEGSFMTETPTDVQYSSCKELIADLKKKYPAINSIVGHKDRLATSCPGKNFDLSKATNSTAGSTGGASSSNTSTGSGSSSTSSASKTTSKITTIKQVQAYVGTAADGIYGSKTKAGIVIKVQKIIWGSKTSEIDGIFGSKSKAQWGTRLVKNGTQSELAKLCQMALICRGYSCGSAGADGIIGSGSVAAIKTYQKASGLTVDGDIGKNTAAKLFS